MCVHWDLKHLGGRRDALGPSLVHLPGSAEDPGRSAHGGSAVSEHLGGAVLKHHLGGPGTDLYARNGWSS